jgi:hypothetical protein
MKVLHYREASILFLAAAFLFCFSSCASHVLSGRGQRNLDEWERSKVYDPVTNRYYHTQNINESQMDRLESDVLD